MTGLQRCCPARLVKIAEKQPQESAAADKTDGENQLNEALADVLRDIHQKTYIATVCSIVIILLGLVSIITLPVAVPTSSRLGHCVG